MPNPEEVLIIERCLEGDEDAFRELVERYQRRVYWIAHNMLHDYDRAQDVAQEAFLRVFKNLHRFDIKKNFYTWLYQITTNLCIDRLRRAVHERPADPEEIAAVPHAAAAPPERLEGAELKDRVRATLKRLPPKYRAVITLRDIEGLSCEEVAAIVGCSNATVRWRIHRGRRLFRALWEGKTAHVGDEDESSSEL